MLALEHVAGRRCVAAIRIDNEIFDGQTEIGFVGDLLGVPGFEAQALMKPGRGIAVELCFQDIVLKVVACACAGISVDVLEAIAFALHGFQKPGETTAVVAEVEMGVAGRVLADPEIERAAKGIRYRCRDQVDGTTGRSGTDADRCRAFQDLECMHASLRREVISRRGGVGRRRDQDAVFQKCDAAASIQA